MVNLTVTTGNCGGGGGGGGGGGNSPPTFVNFNPPTNVCLGNSYTYGVQAQDYDGNPITFSLVNVPSGMVIGSASGIIDWTPTASQVGTHTITVQIRDAFTGPVTISYQLTVSATCGGGGGGGTPTSTPTSTPPTVLGTSTVNLPPYFVGTPPALRACAGSLATYKVDAVDPEGAPLTYSLVTAPAGMTIAQRIGAIFWQPTAAQARTAPYMVTVAVTDGTYTATRTFSAYASLCGTPTPTPPKEPTPPAVQGTSTIATSTCPTTTAVTSEQSPNLFLGALALLSGFGEWLARNYCLLGILLWILTLLAFIAYVVMNEREKRRMQGMIEKFGAGAAIAEPNVVLDDVGLDDSIFEDASSPAPSH